MSKKTKPKRQRKPAKSGRNRPLPFATQGIGILSSIPFQNTTLQTAFQSGLAAAKMYFNIKDNNGKGLGYDQSALKANLQNLNADENVGLIVCVGGSITHAVAFNGAVKPFISVVGGRFGAFPTPTTGKFRGGISTESVSRHGLRLAYLKTKFNIQSDDEICLLHNPNSHMVGNEKPLFKRAAPAMVDPNTPNYRTVYDTAFNAVSALQNPTIKAVMVSADPWFTATAGDLAQAANRWIAQLPAQRAVCYCVQEFVQHKPTGGKRLMHGPHIGAIYKAMGEKAKLLLANSVRGGSNDDADEVIAT